MECLFYFPIFQLSQRQEHREECVNKQVAAVCKEKTDVYEFTGSCQPKVISHSEQKEW